MTIAAPIEVTCQRRLLIVENSQKSIEFSMRGSTHSGTRVLTLTILP
jgi:hypothetical protein